MTTFKSLKSFFASLPLFVMGWGLAGCPDNHGTDDTAKSDDTSADEDKVYMTFNFMIPDVEALYGSPAPRDDNPIFSVDGHESEIEMGWSGGKVEYTFEWVKGLSYIHEVTLEGGGIVCAPTSINWNAASDESKDLSWDADQCRWASPDGIYKNEYGDEYEVYTDFIDADSDNKREATLEIWECLTIVTGNTSTGSVDDITTKTNLDNNLEDIGLKTYRKDGSLMDDMVLHWFSE